MHVSKKARLQGTRGFTLVEALVATSILAVAVTALLNIVAQNVFVSNYVKNKATAISLAQEGVELVRNIQDATLLTTDSPEQFIQNAFGDCTVGSGLCTIDPLTLQISQCPEECPPLRVSSNGYFNYVSGDTSNIFDEVFTRSIAVNQLLDSGSVVVRVSWQQGQTERSVEYETYIFPWIN